MSPEPDDIDELIARMPPMSEAEELEILLGYFSALLEPLETRHVAALRRRASREYTGTPLQDQMIEVIEGELALRELGVSG
jgi:hypothetical protein